MHYFPIGNDDRLFARRIAKRIGNLRLSAPIYPLSPYEIAEKMADSMFCVCMRFHSVVFAQAIGAPYIGIDYTAGGKVANFLRDVGQEARCFSYAQLSELPIEVVERIVEHSKSTLIDTQ
jgi:polysaccharide pyruvyl transferase WcaK-like protein